MSSKWSEQAWTAAQPVYDAILELPFIKELIAGTLPKEKFLFYIKQDAAYIKNYCRVLASIASRSNDSEVIEAFVKYADMSVAVEKAMHEGYLAGCSQEAEISPSNLLYMSYLGAKATEPVEVQAASVLPCFWVYLEVGKYIASKAVKDNPYSQWIDTYSDQSFDEATQCAISLCDKMAANASSEIRQRMTEAYITATKMEWLFWASAYRLEKWEI
ncbi:MAG: thiaminase II [Muribaculaceae bacterium]|nr:thiaminase II [Muribaculaceae bacterium]